MRTPTKVGRHQTPTAEFRIIGLCHLKVGITDLSTHLFSALAMLQGNDPRMANFVKHEARTESSHNAAILFSFAVVLSQYSYAEQLLQTRESRYWAES